MATELADFNEDLIYEIQARATARGGHTRTVFVEELVQRLIEAEELQDWTPSFFEGRGYKRRNIGLDGYSTDDLELDGTLHVIIADPRLDPGITSITTTDVKGLAARVTSFVEDALLGRLTEVLEPSTPAADLVRLIEKQKDEIKTLRILLITNATLGSKFKEIDRNTIDGVKVDLNVWDLARLHQLAGTGGREPVDIDLTVFVPDGLPILPAGLGDTGYSAYLCVVPGSLLADLYDTYGSRLLEGNIRAFLSTSGGVNRGIRRTLQTSPDRFFAFNNGITATATDAEVAQDGNGFTLRRVTDLQIVNGGQTTASLFNTRFKDKVSLDGVFVQMKLSVLPPDVAETMIPDISRFANTQNRVSDADLFANHPFHRKVEELSRRLWAPPRPGSQQMTRWFYERARAQFQTEQLKLTPAKRLEFLAQHPKDQVISKTDLAKFLNTWAKRPDLVSLGAQKNFIRFADAAREEYEKHPARFNERWFQHLVAKAILFKATERLVSAAPWYTGGYRANVVTYGLARFVRLVEQRHPQYVLDLDRIWRTQRVSDTTADQITLCAEAAMRVLTNPPVAGRNVTEWAKQGHCWSALLAEDIHLLPGLAADLKPLAEERGDQGDAVNVAGEILTIDMVMEVVRLAGEGYWRRAIGSPDTRGKLSPAEFGILQKAAHSEGWVPTDAQAKKLMRAYERLVADSVWPPAVEEAA